MKKNKMAKEEINGILIGIYLYANAFVVTLPAINNILVLFLLGVTILYFFNNRSFKIMKASSAIVILLIICWFAVSYILRQGISNITLFDYMTKFLFYGVTAFLITYREFSIKKVYQTITIASILLIPYFIPFNTTSSLVINPIGFNKFPLDFDNISSVLHCKLAFPFILS